MSKRRFSWSVEILLLAVTAALLPIRTAWCEGDPWYRDVDYHWAAPYIYVLWLEGVTDGQLSWWRDQLRAYFLPDSVCTRSQFTVLLAKVFGLSPCAPGYPSYPDVPKDYRMLPGKPAWQWIEAALAGGLTFVPRGRYFYPDSSITREDAVELLVTSLDLGPVAQSLSDQEVVSLLGQFGDGMTTSPERRRSMACAIKFGIINGYEDDTIRPKNPMWRCHAATIVYRSCLIRVSAYPSAFSPDGDGKDETVTLSLAYLKNRGISAWQVIIEDEKGHRIFTFNPDETGGTPPSSLVWDGKDRRGLTVAPGRYYYQASVRDRQGRQFFSVKKPLDVWKHSLRGYLRPEICHDGEILTIDAFTEPKAQSVYGVFSDGQVRYLHRVDEGTRWTMQLAIGPFLPEGPQDVTLVAVFPDIERLLPLRFTRLDSLWLEPDVFPNPAGPGQSIRLFCRTSENVKEVTAVLMGQVVNLTKRGNSWEAETRVSAAVASGEYPVTFTAKTATRQAQGTVILEIRTQRLQDLVFTLIK